MMETREMFKMVKEWLHELRQLSLQHIAMGQGSKFKMKSYHIIYEVLLFHLMNIDVNFQM